MPIDTFLVVESTGYIRKTLQKETLPAVSTAGRQGISIKIISLVTGLLKMSIDTFPVVETTGYISNIAREKRLPVVSISGR